MDAMTIGELAKDTGLTLRAIRFYEIKGLIKPRRAGFNNFVRIYSPEEVEKLRRVITLRRYGFTVAEIKRGVTMRDLIRQQGELRMEQQRLESALVDLITEIEGMKP